MEATTMAQTEQKTTVPWKCMACDKGSNCINGRWCAELARYVEHTSVPPCEFS